MLLQREHPPLARTRLTASRSFVALSAFCTAAVLVLPPALRAAEPVQPRVVTPSGPAPVIVIRPGSTPAGSSSVVPRAADPASALDKARLAFRTGDFTAATSAATASIADGDRDEGWHELLAEVLAYQGDYHKAAAVLDRALDEFPYSIRLRVVAHRVFPHAGQVTRGLGLLNEINLLARDRDWAYRDADNRIALGISALWMGGEPKRVLDLFYEPVRKAKPEHRGAWLAIGRLALDKADFAMAGRVFGDAVKRFEDDPDMLFGLAQAMAGSDGEVMFNAAQRALSINTNHVGARLLLADFHIDAEAYDEARELLDDALCINPNEPEALALKSVLAVLDADDSAARRLRTQALGAWANNPSVDYWIGRKLSQKYRFAEGATHQRTALKNDPEFVPAKIQLAQDLLRLGEDREGWQLADEVSKADPYDVVAYNLVTLKESVSHFRELRTDHFIVRMAPNEAAVYGRDVLDLLERARTTLCAKYGLELKEKVTVEIFPDQKDFAIRTFGMPGGAGYLGVCFGKVITANSPATRPASPSNWEAILWHEFCHVVTLQLTRNRMPRWLSEGISVHEERQANPAWGEHMIPTYRKMLLDDDLTPVSELSGAFLRPKSGLHLQFAYYQSSLVVEFLIERHGLEALRKILSDLGAGVPINDAIARHTAPMKTVDRDFAVYAREIAKATGPGLDWETTVPRTQGLPAEFVQWLGENPKSFAALNARADQLIAASKWKEAVEPLRKLIELYPEQRHGGNAYEKLALVHRRLGETEDERGLLAHIAAANSDAQPAYLRLIELDSARNDWAAVLTNATRLAAVNPLLPATHLAAADAAEALNDAPRAVDALKKAISLNPPDPAALNYRVAALLKAREPEEARRHLLTALEEAPRYRDALRLLVELREATTSAADRPQPPQQTSPVPKPAQ